MDAITKKAHLRVIRYFIIGIVAVIAFIAAIIWLGDYFPLLLMLCVLGFFGVGIYMSALEAAKRDISRNMK